MPPLGVIPDRVAGPHPDPLWDGSVLLALLGQDPLHAEGLQSRHGEKRSFTSLKEGYQAYKLGRIDWLAELVYYLRPLPFLVHVYGIEQYFILTLLNNAL